jgi:hypothetical protein
MPPLHLLNNLHQEQGFSIDHDCSTFLCESFGPQIISSCSSIPQKSIQPKGTLTY